MNTRQWGQLAWHMLHHLPFATNEHEWHRAYSLPMRTHIIDLVKSLPFILPCPYCRDSAIYFVREMPPQLYIFSTIDFAWYLFLLHNAVNRKILQPVFADFGFVLSKYSNLVLKPGSMCVRSAILEQIPEFVPHQKPHRETVIPVPDVIRRQWFAYRYQRRHQEKQNETEKSNRVDGWVSYYWLRDAWDFLLVSTRFFDTCRTKEMHDHLCRFLESLSFIVKERYPGWSNALRFYECPPFESCEVYGDTWFRWAWLSFKKFQQYTNKHPNSEDAKAFRDVHVRPPTSPAVKDDFNFTWKHFHDAYAVKYADDEPREATSPRFQ